MYKKPMLKGGTVGKLDTGSVCNQDDEEEGRRQEGTILKEVGFLPDQQ